MSAGASGENVKFIKHLRCLTTIGDGAREFVISELIAGKALPSALLYLAGMRSRA